MIWEFKGYSTICSNFHTLLSGFLFSPFGLDPCMSLRSVLKLLSSVLFYPSPHDH